MQRRPQTVLITLATCLREDATVQQPAWVWADELAAKGKQKLQCLAVCMEFVLQTLRTVYKQAHRASKSLH